MSEDYGGQKGLQTVHHFESEYFLQPTKIFSFFFSFIIKLKKQIKKRTQIIGIGGKLSFMGFQILVLKIFFQFKIPKILQTHFPAVIQLNGGQFIRGRIIYPIRFGITNPWVWRCII